MPRGRKKKQDKRNLNIIVTTLMFLSILLGVLIYSKQGNLGRNLSPALGGVLGIIKYFIPIGLFIVAVEIAKENNTRNYGQKILMFFLVLLLFDCVSSCYRVSTGDLDITQNRDELLSDAYILGSKDMGGGVIGTSIAAILINIFGTTGTIIACIGVSIILIVFIFDLHPAEMISNSMDKIDEYNEERKAVREKERKIRQREYEENVTPFHKESFKERRERERKEKLSKKSEPLEEQITINLNDSKKENNNDTIEVPNFKNSRSSNKTKLFDNNKNNNDSNSNSNETTNDDSLFAKKEVEKVAKTQEVLNLKHIQAEAEQNYEFPPIRLLQEDRGSEDSTSRKVLLQTAERLRKTLYSFGVSAKVENVSVGPAITRYELSPAEGVRVSKISNLSDDIALALEAETIRIEAPIPGKHTVGIEVPNKSRSIVPLRSIIESNEFIDSESKLTFGLGKDVAGNVVVTDIAKMPHMLIAGSTGSGKSVCINTMITSIIYKAKPSEVKLLMIDPKIVELSVYNGIPHLLIPVVTDPKKAAGALEWAVQEMEKRYSLFADKKVRDIKGYNLAAEKTGELPLPQIVIIIDELADLMMVSSKEVENSICRLAQKARAAGMHLVIATQRPSVNVITGVIKANIPSRIAFAVSSQVDSRTILDEGGAEKLLGKGDMLFYPTGIPKPVRIQGAFVSDKEVENIVKFIRKDGDAIYDTDIMETIDKANEPEKVESDEDKDDTVDPFLDEAIELVVENQQASTSYIQRRFKVGYARAGRIIDQMEERGIISGYNGSKPREVLMSKERWQELKMAPDDIAKNAKIDIGNIDDSNQ